MNRKVFHELTRTMQTRKLIAGETLLLEEEKGFCLVVDGLVQIFVKSAREGRGSDEEPWMNGERKSYREDDEEDHREDGNQHYQLLTEVKNGAPMSSLFSILSLFTEDVRLRHDDEEDTGHESSSSSAGFGQSGFPHNAGFGRDGFTPESGPASPSYGPKSPYLQQKHRERRSSTMVGADGVRLPNVPPLSLDLSSMSQQRQHEGQRSRPKPQKPKSVHPDIVARATVDTTIAIIPATAFRRLTRVYPKATAHIVQVILTRLQRVTLATGHSYLGLTSEVLRTEKHMNKYTTYELPNFLRGGALERLKEKFLKEKERIGLEEGMKGIALHNPAAGRRRRASSLRKEVATQAKSTAPRKAELAMTLDSSRDKERSGISAGDLLTNLHTSRHINGRPQPTSSGAMAISQPLQRLGNLTQDALSPLQQTDFDPFVTPATRNTIHRQESLDEDSIFREAILECMFKAIGLANSKNAIGNKPQSVEHSPRMVSYDSRRQKAVFNNAFGFIDPYEGSVDGDSESMASVSTAFSIGSSASRAGLANELREDVEIVYFPKGAVLVEQGERNPGLYYVIDGFLDVSIPVDEASPESSNVLGASHQLFPGNFEHVLPTLAKTNTNSSRKSGAGPSKSNTAKKRNQSSKSLFLIKPGGIAGYIGTISSYRSFIDVRAKTDVYVGFLPRHSLERIVEKYPVVLLTMAKRLTSLLPRLILHIDFALEWVQVNAGQVIYHQNDDSDAIYIVLNGRLRAILEKDDGGMRVVGEYGQGESVGELEVMTESTRPATLHAIRDTELAKFPKTLFNSLALEHPGITIKISKIIASRMRALVEDPLFEHGRDKSAVNTNRNVTSTLNLRTVTILPITAGAPVVEFGSRLMNALTQIGVPNGVTSLNQAAILNHLGRHAFSRMGKLKLSQYLADLEEKYGMVWLPKSRTLSYRYGHN